MTENTLKVEATGVTMPIAPRGAFAREFTKAYARLMVSSALSPLEDWLKEAQRLSPELDADACMELANTLRSSALIANLTSETAKIMGEENLMYRLAACALNQQVEWAEETLLPYEAARAVKMAMGIGGMTEYLGESLTLLAATGQSGERPRAATPEPTPEPSNAECVR